MNFICQVHLLQLFSFLQVRNIAHSFVQVLSSFGILVFQIELGLVKTSLAAIRFRHVGSISDSEFWWAVAHSLLEAVLFCIVFQYRLLKFSLRSLRTDL